MTWKYRLKKRVTLAVVRLFLRLRLLKRRDVAGGRHGRDGGGN